MALVLDQCPHCKVRHVQATEEGQFASGVGQVNWVVARCQNQACNKTVLVLQLWTGQAGWRILGMYPTGRYELDEDWQVSQEIRDEFLEAGQCLTSGCYRASLVMSRRALQRILKQQGCTQHNLADAIQYAVQNGILRKTFHPLAEEIRQYGNLGAHPDDDQLANANQESASQVLEFVRLLVHEFYELPATAAGLRSKRESAKNKTNEL